MVLMIGQEAYRVEEKLGSRIARVTYEKVRKTRNNYSTDTS